IVARARELGLDVPTATGFEAFAGHGVVAEVEGHRVLIGNERLLREQEIAIGEAVEQAERLAAGGATPVWVAVDGRPAALIAVADPVRPEAREVVAELGALGLETWLLTGDNRQTAEAVARQVGIAPERTLAGGLPGPKAAQGAE